MCINAGMCRYKPAEGMGDFKRSLLALRVGDRKRSGEDGELFMHLCLAFVIMRNVHSFCNLK